MSRNQVGLPHIPALDGLRGLGVLGILLFHAGHLRGGWLGVDLFFVLSGFLITSLLLAESEGSGRISLRHFWARRARRLFPALLLALFGVAVFAAVFAEPAEHARIRADGLATLFYVANWHGIWAGHDYWELFNAPSPLDHTWSLAIEEQFYIFWPPIVVFVMARVRKPVRAIAIGASALAVLSALWMALLFTEEEGTARVYFGTDTRVAATLVGAALAALLHTTMQRYPKRSIGIADAGAALAVAILAWAWLSLEGADPIVYRGGLLALSLAAAAVIGGVVLAPDGVTARVLGLGPLRFLGIVSYGAYLWHWPLYLVLTPDRVGLDGALLTAIRVATSVAVASASYWGFERPIRQGVVAPRPLALAGGVAFTVVVVSLFVSTQTGIQDRDRYATESALEAHVQDGESRPDILLIGDSIAEQLGPVFRARAQARGLSADVRGQLGCFVMKSNGVRFASGQSLIFPNCGDALTDWRAFVSRKSPQVVVILEESSGLGERRIQQRWFAPCTPGFNGAYEADVSEAIDFFSEQGSKTAIVMVPPISVEDFSPRARQRWFGESGAPDRDKMVAGQRCHDELRAEVARSTGARLVDLKELVCPGGLCRRKINDVLLRPDGVHFRGKGAVLAADWLLDRLVEMELVEERSTERSQAH